MMLVHSVSMNAWSAHFGITF